MVAIALSAAGAKKAASRLREFLAADGITLKQTHAYEALAQTLGYANWNTLQALLNATALTESAASPAATDPADKQTERTDEKPKAERIEKIEQIEVVRKPNLSGHLEQSLHRALGLASTRHHLQATLEHLLLALTEDQDAVPALRACGVDLEQLRKGLTDFIDGSKLDHLVAAASGEPKPTADFQRVVQRAALHTLASGRELVDGANVLVALLSERESPSVDFLQRQGMTRLDAVNYVSNGTSKAGTIFTPGSEASLSEEEELRRLGEEFRKRREEIRRKRRPPQTPTAGVPVEPRPKPKLPLKAEAKLKERN